MDETLFTNILVPIDGSESSVQAARLAFRVAKVCGATVTLLYVVDTVVMDELRKFEQEHSQVQAELRENGWRYLDYVTKLAEEVGLAVQTELREGEPYAEIVSLADSMGADLIVMGHVGRRGPRRILVGSVTERVIEFAHCPVLVAKAST